MMRSLQTRLTLAVSILALAAVVAVSVTARQGTRREFLKFREEVSRSTTAGPRAAAASLAQSLDGTCCAGAALEAAARNLAPRELLLVMDERSGGQIAAAGTPASQLRDLRAVREDDVLRLSAKAGAGGLEEQITLQFNLPGIPLRLADGRMASLYVLQLPLSDGHTAAFLKAVDLRLVFVTALVGLAAMAVTWVIARRTVRPLRELQAATEALARGDLTRRVDPRGGDEVAQLARAFNSMAGELQRQQNLRRSLLDDVTHELRTPVTSLRCRLESVLDGITGDPVDALRGANDDVIHLGQLVDDLQEIALAEARELRLVVADVPVSSVVESAVRAAGLDRDPRLRIELVPDLVLRADALRTRQVLTNLLTNAARHTPADGRITVSARQDGPLARIEVQNSGSTLTGGQLERVFDRFYRTDESRQRATGGTGLGLAIVKNLVEAQGGSVWVRGEQDGVIFGFALEISERPGALSRN